MSGIMAEKAVDLPSNVPSNIPSNVPLGNPSSSPRPAQLSVNILLPEAIDRRLERWAQRMPGASWPAWGGHVTLVPKFVPRVSVEEVRAILMAVCEKEMPFAVRFGAPLAVQDSTRPNFAALFLKIEEVPTNGDSGDGVARLVSLRSNLLTALAPVREDVRPQLTELPFLPHVTLALGLGESEANRLVRQMRAEPIVADFGVEVIWLVIQTSGEGGRVIRQPIALGTATPLPK